MATLTLTITRAPNDDYSHRLFKDLMSQIDGDCVAYYLWTNPVAVFDGVMTNADFSTHKNVILGVKDLMDGWEEFNYWDQAQQSGIALLDHVVRKFHDTNFVLFTSYEHLDREINQPNLQIVPWGGDIVNQSGEYPTVDPVLDKNFSSPKHFISLNRNSRTHRIFLLSYLFGRKYDRYGHLTFLGKTRSNLDSEFLNIVSWCFSEGHDDIRSTVMQGYKRLSSKFDNDPDKYEIYDGVGANNNVYNFKHRLAPLYQDSFVEIVTETTFASPAFMITEKVLNSIYGCNFPIVLSGQGAVQHLRDIGFDMFDDVINHSYDSISNPIDRIAAAVDLNAKILSDGAFAKEKWRECQHRFENNVLVAKNMCNWFTQRTKTELEKVVWK